jgi:hypothetical protein
MTHRTSHRMYYNTPEEKNMPKSQLPYLILEALQAGKWTFKEADKAGEVYAREGEEVRIGLRPLRGTDPVSYVYEVHDLDLNFRKVDKLVINLLCVRLAKTSKMSEWFDSMSTTTE